VNFTKTLFWRQKDAVNPCLWTKYTEHGIVFVETYFDNGHVIGNENGINNIIDGLKTYKFGLKIADNLKDYLICRVLTDYERKITFVMQTNFIKNLREKFESEVINLNDYGMPGTPRFKILRLIDETEKIDYN
jgi:hypothetical protein